MIKRGVGGVSRFSVENFVFHSAEKCRRGHLKVSLNLGIENFVFQRFMSLFSIFCRNFFVSQCRKMS